MKNDDDIKLDQEPDLEESLEEDASQSEFSQKLDEAETKYKRALADYQNLEKRVIEDRREWIKSSNKDLLMRLLPVLDTLILAAKHDDNKTLQISVSQFLDILKTEGVTKIKTEDQVFDPQTMECVTMIEGEDGKVIEEVRVGFMINEKLLRPAQVIVGEKKK